MHFYPRAANQMPPEDQWEKFLNPSALKERLVSASLFITGFELIRESIIGRIRSFLSHGFGPEGDSISEDYKKEILSRNKSVLYASLSWLIEHEVIDEYDLESFERIKATRNSLAHQLPSFVIQNLDFNHVQRFQELVTLLRKIEVWWIVNVEIPLHPEYDSKIIDEKGIVPGPILIIQMMLEVISGNEELLKQFKSGVNPPPHKP